MSESHEDEHQKIDDQTQLGSDLSKQWADLRTVVESYANDYFFKAPAKRATAEEWIQDGFTLTSYLTTIWLKGLAIAAKEGSRMAAAELKNRDTDLGRLAKTLAEGFAAGKTG